jgi:hypothetical protein
MPYELAFYLSTVTDIDFVAEHNREAPLPPR